MWIFMSSAFHVPMISKLVKCQKMLLHYFPSDSRWMELAHHLESRVPAGFTVQFRKLFKAINFPWRPSASTIIGPIWLFIAKCHHIYYVILMLRPSQRQLGTGSTAYSNIDQKTDVWLLMTCAGAGRTWNWTWALKSQPWFFGSNAEALGSWSP